MSEISQDQSIKKILEELNDMKRKLNTGKETEFQFKEGDIVTKTSDDPFPNFQGKYAKVTEGNHGECERVPGASWVSVKFSNGRHNSYPTTQLELVWRDPE